MVKGPRLTNFSCIVWRVCGVTSGGVFRIVFISGLEAACNSERLESGPV